MTKQEAKLIAMEIIASNAVIICDGTNTSRDDFGNVRSMEDQQKIYDEIELYCVYIQNKVDKIRNRKKLEK